MTTVLVVALAAAALWGATEFIRARVLEDRCARLRDRNRDLRLDRQRAAVEAEAWRVRALAAEGEIAERDRDHGVVLSMVLGELS